MSDSDLPDRQLVEQWGLTISAILLATPGIIEYWPEVGPFGMILLACIAMIGALQRERDND
jgi:hypothetical protein